MSLVTRCPACQTLFKVVPDQLRISDGWVRCGRCGEVFDGSAAAVAGLPDPPEGASQAAGPGFPSLPEPGPPPADPRPPYYIRRPDAEPAAAVPPAAPRERPPPPRTMAPEPVQVQVPASAPPAPAAPSELADEPSALLLHTASDALPDAAADAADASAGFVPSKPPPLGDADIDELVHPPAVAAAPGFVRDARRRAFWRRPAVRAVLLLLCLALAVALGLQAAVQERDRLASLLPASRPALERACAWLGCRVGVLQQIESIAIDSSSFQRTRGDAFQLRVTLRSTAAMPLAMPSLELTLTDSSDQPVLRRVLNPADYGATGNLPAQGELSGGATVAVGGTPGRVAGYRLLAFYP